MVGSVDEEQEEQMEEEKELTSCLTLALKMTDILNIQRTTDGRTDQEINKRCRRNQRVNAHVSTLSKCTQRVLYKRYSRAVRRVKLCQISLGLVSIASPGGRGICIRTDEGRWIHLPEVRLCEVTRFYHNSFTICSRTRGSD